MPFQLPNFNSIVAVYRAINPPPAAPEFLAPCQLRYPGRGPQDLFPGPLPQWFLCMQLLVNKTVDLRDPYSPSGQDIVEVPAGSGRIYKVMLVDQVALGFTNEYRIAWIAKVAPWPEPTP